MLRKSNPNNQILIRPFKYKTDSLFKSYRFSYKENGTHCFYYSLPSVKNTRAASIGIGSKTDFGKLSNCKNSNIYNQIDYDAVSPRSPSYSFGAVNNYCQFQIRNKLVNSKLLLHTDDYNQKQRNKTDKEKVLKSHEGTKLYNSFRGLYDLFSCNPLYLRTLKPRN